MTVFARDGVDAGVRQVAEQAGVGVGTVYRHFPQRSDLIIAVFRREVDACAEAAAALAAVLAETQAHYDLGPRRRALQDGNRFFDKSLCLAPKPAHPRKTRQTGEILA